MISVQERLDYLDGVMAELAYAQLRSEMAMKDLKKQMEAHITEMQRDREEWREERLKDREEREQERQIDREEWQQERLKDREEWREERLKDREEWREERLKDRAEREQERQIDREEREKDRERMRRDREERKADTRAMKKAWGDLANKLGTVAEDIVAPNIPRLAMEEFGFPEVEDLLVRVRRASRRGEKRQTEYDVICSGPDKIIVVEVKSSPKREDILAFPARLAEFFDFYPEYEGRERIGMFASWSIAEKLLPTISQAGLYGLAMGEETMEIVARPD